MEYKRDITICVIDMNDSYSRFMCNHEVKLWRETIISIKKITTRSDSIICEHVYTNMLNLILFGGVFTMFCFDKNIIGSTSNSCIRILYTVALLIFAGNKFRGLS